MGSSRARSAFAEAKQSAAGHAFDAFLSDAFLLELDEESTQLLLEQPVRCSTPADGPPVRCSTPADGPPVHCWTWPSAFHDGRGSCRPSLTQRRRSGAMAQRIAHGLMGNRDEVGYDIAIQQTLNIGAVMPASSRAAIGARAEFVFHSCFFDFDAHSGPTGQARRI